MGFFSQLGLVLWKNWTIQRKRLAVCFFQIIIPVGFAGILLLLRTQNKTQPPGDPIYYPEENLDTPNLDILNNTFIGYAPDGGTETKKLVQYMSDTFDSQFPNINATFRGFTDEDAMINYYKANSQDMHLGVIFKNVDSSSTSLPTNLDFIVRPSTAEKDKWETGKAYPNTPTNGPRGQDKNYVTRGVLYMQKLVGESLIKYWLSETGGDPASIDIGMYIQRFAYPPYVKDGMISFNKDILSLLIVLSFILTVILNTKDLVYEKERKLKESMKLMGLKSSVHWLSWFITFSIYITPALILYAVLICANVISSEGPILRQSEGFLFFVFLGCYGFSIITFCFMVSTFVQKANVGAGVAGILFFGFYAPYFYVNNSSNYDSLSKSEKLGFGLMFNSAMAIGTRIYGLYEGTGEGVQWSNFHKPVAVVNDNISVLDCMLMMIADGFIHLIIYWYIENVRPGEFGVPKPFYFCFTKSYWVGTAKSSSTISYHDVESETNPRFEKDPDNLRAGISIKGLRKEFGSKKAVQGVSMNMYGGQITVLLGHNGAGKTTTMSMLTGFIPPTSGTAMVNGYDITENIDGVRSSLGLCPQHNILFDTLTVKEHLQFFARLKGASSKQAEKEIDPLITEVGLFDKMNEQSQNLSGGQKRKLSVAIALIAGSKIVILDEPSSGMDPAARRQTWDVLQKHREGRTMLLTTHYMDEADVLGDRIAIMAEGVVKCCGTSLFLKKLYGAGYHLVIVKNQNCNISEVTRVVQSHIHQAKLEGIINLEVTYLLPDKDTDKFCDLFVELESRKEELGISSFGTSATTMEEVFLKVGDGADHHDASYENSMKGISNQALDVRNESADSARKGHNKVHSSDESMELGVQNGYGSIMDFNRGFRKRTGVSLEMARMYAMFIKKALHTWRNRVVTIVQFLLPIIFAIAGLGLEMATPETIVPPTLTFDMSKFGSTVIPTTAGLNPSQNDTDLLSVYNQQFGNRIEPVVLSASGFQTYDNYTLEKIDKIGIADFNERVIIGFELGPKSVNTSENIHAIAHYNGEPLHSRPISVNYMINALLKFYLNSSSYNLQSGINPLPLDNKEDANDSLTLVMGRSFIFGLFISFGMSFLTTLFIQYLIKERQVGAKHIQVVSGVNPFCYWIPTFLWDFINYIVPGFLLLIVFLCFQKEEFVGDERSLYVILVLIVYGWAMIPFMYVLQFRFKEPPTGVVAGIMINLFSGFFCLTMTFVMRLPAMKAENIADVCDYIFMALFPNYGFAQCFMSIYLNYGNSEYCKDVICTPTTKHGCCKDTCEKLGSCVEHQDNYLAYDRPGIGAYVLSMAIQGAVYLIVVMLIEYNVLERLKYFMSSSKGNDSNVYNGNRVEDSDVAAERQRINSNPAAVLSQTDSMVLTNLFKQYGEFVAVDHICVGIPEQECFGLLGQNGAGKTSTFKMLTGEIPVTGGNAYLNGHDIRNNIKAVQENLGYCPQFDALIDQMTGRETLTMYARLRGVPELNIPDVVDHLIEALMLVPHADYMAGTYSGGNKRKLSTAMALVGDPHFIMLDEPSAGMDPKARRQMWNILSQVRASGRTLILTSHSMEECDALCTRVAIMVNGRFVCLGSPQHLKNKFGQGYTLIVQMDEDSQGKSEPIQPVVDYIVQNFPGAKVFDDHEGYIHFQVPDSNVKLAQVFSVMNSTKANLKVQDYSVHQTTLEQVFLMFTKSQTVNIPPPKKRRICCCRC